MCQDFLDSLQFLTRIGGPTQAAATFLLAALPSGYGKDHFLSSLWVTHKGWTEEFTKLLLCFSSTTDHIKASL